MSVILNVRPDRTALWKAALVDALPGETVDVWPKCADIQTVEAIVTADPLSVSFDRFTSLRFIAATGAGVDRLLASNVPLHIPIVRLVDDRLTEGMVYYVTTVVMRYHRQFDLFEAAQRRRQWIALPRPDPSKTRVSILGLGVLGRATGQHLARLGFDVQGWSRSAKAVPGIRTAEGADGLAMMLATTDILVCLLPLTDETRGIIDALLLARLPPGARIINVGRGAHVVDEDLLAALNCGHLAHATLDVTAVEPLPDGHPFWMHDKITLTPHVASLTVPENAARSIATAVRQARAGTRFDNVVDRRRGY